VQARLTFPTRPAKSRLDELERLSLELVPRGGIEPPTKDERDRKGVRHEASSRPFVRGVRKRPEGAGSRIDLVVRREGLRRTGGDSACTIGLAVPGCAAPAPYCSPMGRAGAPSCPPRWSNASPPSRRTRSIRPA